MDDEEHYQPKTMAMKRKSSDDVSYEFSLSSPAIKIRRLDADLSPIVEEYEREVPIVTLDRDSACGEHVFASKASTGGLKIEELPDVPENNELALVPFNSKSDASPLSRSPSSFSISIDPRLISGLKNQVSWSSKSGSWLIEVSNGAAEDENDSDSGKGCLAVVPWVPSQDLPQVSPQIENVETMDADEIDDAIMEIEEEDVGVQQPNITGGSSFSEGLQQWQQHHCMIPQPPSNNPTAPVYWYR